MVELSDEVTRTRSAAVFGNRYVADVVAAIASLASDADAGITVRMIAHCLGLSDSLVRPVMKRLVDAGLLTPHVQQRPRGPNYHEVQLTSPLWQALERTCRLLRHDRALHSGTAEDTNLL